MALSEKTPAEVIAVQIQTGASVVGVTHLSGGKIIRCVEHVDGGWTRVEGTPQPWEQKLFDEDAKESALERQEDSEGVEEIFRKAQLEAGSSLPYPDEFKAMCLALGVERADWHLVRGQAPRQILKGSRRSFGPLILLGVTVACAIGAVVVGRGDARALLASLSVVLLLVSLGAGFMRMARVGKWFF